MADYNVTVDIDVLYSKLRNAEKEIESLDGKKVNIEPNLDLKKFKLQKRKIDGSVASAKGIKGLSSPRKIFTSDNQRLLGAIENLRSIEADRTKGEYDGLLDLYKQEKKDAEKSIRKIAGKMGITPVFPSSSSKDSGQVLSKSDLEKKLKEEARLEKERRELEKKVKEAEKSGDKAEAARLRKEANQKRDEASKALKESSASLKKYGLSRIGFEKAQSLFDEAEKQRKIRDYQQSAESKKKGKKPQYSKEQQEAAGRRYKEIMGTHGNLFGAYGLKNSKITDPVSEFTRFSQELEAEVRQEAIEKEAREKAVTEAKKERAEKEAREKAEDAAKRQAEAEETAKKQAEAEAKRRQEIIKNTTKKGAQTSFSAAQENIRKANELNAEADALEAESRNAEYERANELYEQASSKRKEAESLLDDAKKITKKNKPAWEHYGLTERDRDTSYDNVKAQADRTIAEFDEIKKLKQERDDLKTKINDITSQIRENPDDERNKGRREEIERLQQRRRDIVGEISSHEEKAHDISSEYRDMFQKYGVNYYSGGDDVKSTYREAMLGMVEQQKLIAQRKEATDAKTKKALTSEINSIANKHGSAWADYGITKDSEDIRGILDSYYKEQEQAVLKAAEEREAQRQAAIKAMENMSYDELKEKADKKAKSRDKKKETIRNQERRGADTSKAKAELEILEQELDDIRSARDKAKEKEGIGKASRGKTKTTPSPTTSASGGKKTSTGTSDLSEFKDKTVTVTVKADTEKAKSDINSLIAIADGKTVDVTVKADTENAKSEINSFVNMYDSKTIDITVNADTEKAKSEINFIDSKADGESAKIKIDANIEEAKQEINTFTAYAEGETVKVNVDANLTPAKNTIRALSTFREKRPVKVNVDANLTSAKKTIKTLSSFNKDKPVKVNVDANLSPAKKTIRTLSSLSKDEPVNINVDADTTAAKAEINSLISWIESNRATIDVDVDVDKMRTGMKNVSETSAKEMSKSMHSVSAAADDASRKVKEVVKTGNDAAHGRAGAAQKFKEYGGVANDLKKDADSIIEAAEVKSDAIEKANDIESKESKPKRKINGFINVRERIEKAYSKARKEDSFSDRTKELKGILDNLDEQKVYKDALKKRKAQVNDIKKSVDDFEKKHVSNIKEKTGKDIRNMNEDELVEFLKENRERSFPSIEDAKSYVRGKRKINTDRKNEGTIAKDIRYMENNLNSLKYDIRKRIDENFLGDATPIQKMFGDDDKAGVGELKHLVDSLDDKPIVKDVEANTGEAKREINSLDDKPIVLDVKTDKGRNKSKSFVPNSRVERNSSQIDDSHDYNKKYTNYARANGDVLTSKEAFKEARHFENMLGNVRRKLQKAESGSDLEKELLNQEKFLKAERRNLYKHWGKQWTKSQKNALKRTRQRNAFTLDSDLSKLSDKEYKDAVNHSYDDYKSIEKRLADNIKKRQGLSNDSELAKQIDKENKILRDMRQDVYSNWSDKWTDKQRADLDKARGKQSANLAQNKAKLKDSSFNDERGLAFNRFQFLEGNIHKIEKKMLSADKGSSLEQLLEKQWNEYDAERSEIEDKWKDKWTDKQKSSIQNAKDRYSTELAQKEAELAGKQKSSSNNTKKQTKNEGRDIAYQAMRDHASRIVANKKKLQNLDVGSELARTIKQENKKLETDLRSTYSQWENQLTRKQFESLQKFEWKGDLDKEQSKSAKLDKQRREQANSDFNKASNAASKFYANQKKLVGLAENSNLAEEIRTQNAILERDLKAAKGTKNDWTRRQTEALQRIEDNGKRAVAQEKAKLKDKIAKDVDGGKFSDSNNDILDDLRDLNKESDETRDSFDRLKDAHDELMDARDSGDTERLIQAEREYNDALNETRENIEKDRERDGTRKNKLDFDSDFKDAHGLEDGNRMLDDYSKKLDDIDKKSNRMGFGKRMGIGILASFGAEALIQGLMMMFQQILAVDSAMIELKRVTNLTSQEYDKMYDKMITSSKEYGATLSDTIQSTSEWVRLGFDPESAIGLSEVSAMYQHIADVDVATANDNLVTAYKGFEDQLTEMYGGDSVDAINYAADIYNEIGNKFALSSADVGAGLSRAASALSVAGNTIQESAAMVTGITEVTQDPEKAGNALKIVSMRLRGMKGEVEQIEAGAGEGVESISKMQTQIMNMTDGRVNIFDKNGDFKSTYEILGDIAAIWDTLSSVDQATLLETIAGKNRANDTAALLSNWENVEEAMVVASDAEGSAYREHQKYMESIQGHIDVLQSSFQVFATTLLNTDTVIGLVDALAGILDFFTGLMEAPGIIKAIAASLVVATAATVLFRKNLVQTIATDGLKGIADGLRNIASGGFLASKSMNTLKGAMLTFGAAALAALAIFAVFAAINHAGKRQEELEQKVEDVVTEFDNQNETLKENQKLINKSGLRYAELSKGVSKVGKNVSLTTEEYDEYLDLTNQLGEALPELIQGYDAEGNVILKVKGEVALEEIQLAQDEQVKEASTDVINESADIFEEFKNSADDLPTDVASFNLLGELLNSEDIEKDIDALRDAEGLLPNRFGEFDNFKRFLMGEGYGATQEAVESKESFEDTDWLNWLFTEKYSDMQDEYDAIEMEMKEQSKGMSSLAEAYINKRLVEDGYKDMPEDMKSVITGIIPEMDYEFFTQFENYGDMTSYLNNMLSTFKNLDTYDQNAIKTVFELETKLNNGEISIGEYEEGLASFETALSGMDEETKEMVKMSLGFELDDDGNIIDSALDMRDNVLETLRNTVDENTEDDIVPLAMSDAASEFLVDNLSQKELNALSDLLADNKIDSAWITEYENELRGLIALSDVTGLDPFTEMFGNVDLSDADRVIEWNEENLEKYKSQLMSWNEVGEDGQKLSWSDVKSMYSGNVSTVEGGWDTVEGIDIAFTPYMMTDNGLELLSKDVVNEYIDEIFKLAKKDDNEVTAAELLSFDMQGLTIQGKKVSNIIASVGRNAEEVSEMMHYAGEHGAMSMTKLMEVIEREANVQAALSYTIDIEAETAGIESVKTALTETMTAAGVTEASITALSSRFLGLSAAGKTVEDLFEATATGMRMNTDVFYELEDALATQQLKETTDNLEVMKEELARVEEIINDTSSTASDVSWAIGRRDELLAHMNLLGQQAALYEGLTNKYAEWQRAEEAGNNRDMYESVLTAKDTVKDELSRGWADDGTIKYLELLTGRTDLAGKTLQEVRSVFNGLDNEIKDTGYSISDFLTVDGEGNSTSQGVWNFLKAINNMEGKIGDAVTKHKDGSYTFDFEVAGGDEAIAEALGISEELVDIMLSAARDAGFEVNFEGAYQEYSKIVSSAEEAQRTFNELNKDAGKTLNFDFDSGDINKVSEDLTTATGELEKFKRYTNKNGDEYLKIDKKTGEVLDENGKVLKGGKELLEMTSTLQITRDRLSDPAYMTIDASAIDKELQDPIKKLQEYDTLLAEQHQAEIKGHTANKAYKENAKAMEETFKYFKKMRDEDEVLAKKFGIDDMSDEELREALENQTLEMPTELNLTANIDENLTKMLDLMLIDRGLKDPIEVPWYFEESTDGKIDGIDFSKYDEAQIDVITKFINSDEKVGDKTIQEWMNGRNEIERQMIVDFYVKNTDAWNEDFTSEEKKIAIKFVSNNEEFLSEFNEDEQSRIINFKVDNNKWIEDNVKLEDREILYKFVAEKGNPKWLNNLGEDNKEIAMKFITDNSDFLSWYTNDEIKQVVTLALNNPDVIDKINQLDDDKKQIVFDCLVSNPNILDGIAPENLQVAIEFLANNPNFLEQYKDPVTQQIVLEYIAENGKDAWDNLGKDKQNKHIKEQTKARKEAASAEEEAADAQAEAAGNQEEAANAQTEAANAQTEAANAQATANQSGDKPEPEEKPEEKPETKPEPEPEEKPEQKPKDTYASDSLLNKTLKWFGEYGDNKIEQGSADSGKDIGKTKDTYASDSLFSKALKWISESGKEESKDKPSEKPKQEEEPKEKPKDTYASDSLLGKALKWIDEGGESYQKIKQGPSDSDNGKKSDSLLVKGLKWFSENNPFKAGTAYASEITPEVEVEPVNTTADVTVDTNTTVNDTSNQETQATVQGNNTPINTTKPVFAKTDTKVDDTTNQDTESAVNGNNTPINVTKPVTVTTQPFVGGGALSPTAAVGVTANVTGQGKVDTLNNTVNALPTNPTVDVKANVTGKGLVDNLAQSIRNLPTTKTITITTVRNTMTGKGGGNESPAAGTAHASGTFGRAFADGNWGINGSGVALGGELGQELVVRNGRFFTIGDQGAEFFKYKKNDIVFNASQTASLFKYGGIKGANPRGKMLASGSAFAGGTVPSSGLAFTGSSGSGGADPFAGGGGTTTKKDTKDTSKDTNAKDEAKEVFDWIEVLIDRIERLIERLGKTAESVYKTWAQRSKAITQSIAKTKEEINYQWQGYNRYMKQANSVTISKDKKTDAKYKKLVQDGKIDIETIKNEKLAEKIKEYQEW